jgi:hypothetical protein
MTNLLEITSAEEDIHRPHKKQEKISRVQGIAVITAGWSLVALQDIKFNTVYGVVFTQITMPYEMWYPSTILPTPEGGEPQSQHWTILSWLHGTKISNPVNRNHVRQH